MKRLLLLCLLCAFTVLAACGNTPPPTYPAVLYYWRPISNPTVLMQPAMAQDKLDYDIAQCKCSNFPINGPHHEMAQIAPDLGRLAETSAQQVDGAGGCVSSPGAVLVECMRARGWEPTSCSGRIPTAGGTICALTINPNINYPEDYPHRGPRDTSFIGDANSPAQRRQVYP